MNNNGLSTALSVIALICALAVAGYAAIVAPAAAPATNGNDASAETADALEDLAVEVAQLSKRVTDLDRAQRNRPALESIGESHAADIDALRGTVDALNDRLDGLPEGGSAEGAAPGAQLTPAQVDQVLEAQAAREEVQRQEQEAARAESSRERMAAMRTRVEEGMDELYPQRLQDMTEQLGLSAWQHDQVEEGLNARREATLAIFDPEVADADRNWGAFRTLGTEYDEKMQEVLTPQQYEMYQENDLDNFRGSFGMGGMGGARRGGGGNRGGGNN